MGTDRPVWSLTLFLPGLDNLLLMFYKWVYWGRRRSVSKGLFGWAPLKHRLVLVPMHKKTQ